MLGGLSIPKSPDSIPVDSNQPILGIGLDCCVIPLRHGNLRLIQTTDFFYPLIDDPFTMGRIACCNVLSDLYAMGVHECDNMLMLLGVSTALKEDEAKICVHLLMQGFHEAASEAGTSVQGGQTVRNPWLLIGGVATSICREVDYILPSGAEPGDVLVLTKPLGTQVAVNTYQWMMDAKQFLEEDPPKEHPRWKNASSVVTEGDACHAYNLASQNMSRLNKNAAQLMHKYKAHGATDVTGFGIVGHANNLAQCQDRAVNFVISTFPILPKMKEVDEANGYLFGLMKGRSAETSGGLLVILPPDAAQDYCKELQELDGYPAWIVGKVESAELTPDRQRQAIFVDELCVESA